PRTCPVPMRRRTGRFRRSAMLPPEPKKTSPNKAPDSTPERVGLAPEPAPAEPAPPPAAVTAPPGLGTMMHAFRRCWWWALPVGLLAGALAAGVSLLVYPGSYASSVVFRLRPQSGLGSSEEEGHFANVQRAHVALVKSHSVLAEVIEKSQVAEKYGVTYEPQSLAKRLTVTFLEGPEVMTVTLTGENPEVLAAILNALGEAYPARVAQTEDDRLKARIVQLRRRLDVSGDRRDPGRAL